MYHFWKEFDWIKQNRKTLVVTIGESWTWGDSLGKTQHKIFDDKEFRLANVYGRRLADTLQADFLNIAKPGWHPDPPARRTSAPRQHSGYAAPPRAD